MYQKKEKNEHGVGRKGYWKPEYTKQVYKLALLSATDKQIADFFGIKPTTLDYWKQHKPEFTKALKKGKMEADAKVAKALYHRAIGYTHDSVQILSNRVEEYNMETKTRRSWTEPLVVPIKKHYPPDSWACLKWLSLRQKEQWADIQKVDINHNITGSIDIHELQNQLSDPNRITTEEIKLALKLGIMRAAEQLTPAADN